MPLREFVIALLVSFSAISAQPPLPQLRTEPTTGGSIFYVRNIASQPLTGYLIELVNYPGSSYSLWQDEVAAEPVLPGVEKRLPVSNMTVGAVPDYVKIQAALYADGTSSGIPEKVAQFIERRRFVLETTRELIRRVEKGQSAADLRQWADSMQPPGKSKGTINQAAARTLIAETAAHFDDATLTRLRTSERALAASKPAL
jgi:hypothetical protein